MIIENRYGGKDCGNKFFLSSQIGTHIDAKITNICSLPLDLKYCLFSYVAVVHYSQMCPCSDITTTVTSVKHLPLKFYICQFNRISTLSFLFNSIYSCFREKEKASQSCPTVHLSNICLSPGPCLSHWYNMQVLSIALNTNK